MKGRLSILLACLLLGACAVGEDYKRPDFGLTNNWGAMDVGAEQDSSVDIARSDVSMSPGTENATPAGNQPAGEVVAGTAAARPQAANRKHHKVPKEESDLQRMIVIRVVQPDYLTSPVWWERFNDPLLNDLLSKAQSTNNDVKIAKAHIDEVRGNARTATSVLFPQVNATTSLAHNGAGSGALADTVKQVGLSAAWDIDIFGGDARNIEAAQDEIQASQADSKKALLTVLANVASNYVQLRSLQQQRALTVKNLKMQEDTLKVTLGQRHEGAVSDLEVARAKAQVSGTAARLPQINTAMVAALNRLSVLTGEQPHTLDGQLVNPESIPEVPTEIVVSTPLDVVERRPDILGSERRLAEATALSGAAFAELFPKVTLQGFFGGQWSKIYGFSTPLNASASALTPILDWGRIHGQIDATNARQEEAYLTYRQTVLLALEEIENALTSYLNEQKRQALLDETVRQQRKATEVATEQYKVGAATQLDLLTAENSQLEAENDLTVSKAALAVDLIQLYTAMGEAWAPEISLDNLALANESAGTSGFFAWAGF